MFTKLYRIVQLHSKQEDDEIMQNMPQALKERCYLASKKIGAMTYGTPNGDVMYALMDELDVANMNEVSAIVGFRYELIDVTKEAINGEIEELKTYETLKELIENFLRKNLTINMVLDKINEKGIDSLNDVDREILNNCSLRGQKS